MEVRETVDAVPNRNSRTLGSVENARTSIVAVTIGDQAIVSERVEDQVGGNLQEVAGDFNVVTSNEERKGGRLPCQTAVNEFVEFINGNALIDTTSFSFKFSWSNKRHGDKRMVQKIDRILVNQKWIDAATGWRSKILQRRILDHSPIVGWFTAIPKPHNIPFRFKKHWIKHESLKEVVKQSWEERLEDVPIRKVMKKLKRSKRRTLLMSSYKKGNGIKKRN
ncbi:hypothetical protein IFM89_002924 [Coptis chinensis]|uniref:Uncharacterized protein n=1 Tax=Coptis chinensis TaxID=261450 RepID=A0A835IKM2_9MAGN|nr:hypothetical protein IFM89_002924 [Coptis chinensis]